jgi:hypothetical protein
MELQAPNNKKAITYIVVAFIIFSFKMIGQQSNGLVTIYAYPINAFTKIPLNEYNIKDAARCQIIIKEDTSLYSGIQKLVKKTTRSKDNNIKSDLRILIEITKNDTLHLVKINKGEKICLDDTCYEYSKEISDYILKYLPAKDKRKYTPMYQ